MSPNLHIRMHPVAETGLGEERSADTMAWRCRPFAPLIVNATDAASGGA